MKKNISNKIRLGIFITAGIAVFIAAYILLVRGSNYSEAPFA
jgi:hypothetical protein